MTWNSACSIASDDESSRHSFLSDCDSEFDLRPPPRYPAEKRTYSGLNKLSLNRIEPPLTRSRAKATGKPLETVESLSKPRRQSALRRSIDAFTGIATTLTNSLNNNNNNSILFPKQESSNSSTDRILNAPLDGVNILADRFESCSLDEGKLNRNCVWPSRETNSHYTRPINSVSSLMTFGATPFSKSNPSPFFAQPSTSNSFGQEQAQLWSRFRYAASTLRNDSWMTQTDATLQEVPSNLFTSNYQNFTTDQSSTFFSSQIVPTRLLPFQNRTSPPVSTIEETSLRQRQNTPINNPILSTSDNEQLTTRSSSSKFVFTFIIFIIGLVLGCLLTNTLPIGLIWQTLLKYMNILYVHFQTMIKSLAYV